MRRGSTSPADNRGNDNNVVGSRNGVDGPSGSTTTVAAQARLALARKATLTHSGILGCIKQRIFADMLDPVEGDYNILICDNKGANILSTCVRMHDLMDHGVTLVEDLGMPRQPVLSSAAIYLIEPTEESVRRVMGDWQSKKTYREAHLFFTSPSTESLWKLIASEPRLVDALKTVKDMLLDFMVPESLLFHFHMYGDIAKLFPPETALSGGRENILGQVATRLVSVFFTMGAGVPTVQYQGSSRLAQQVARLFVNETAVAARTNPSIFRMASVVTAHGGLDDTTDEPPLLLLVDRSFDAAECVLHERTYQCLLNDLMPLENNIYEQTFDGRSGQGGKRSCSIDEQDPYWCQYRHKFFPLCLSEFPKKLEELTAANPALAKGMNSMQAGGGSSSKLADVGNAIRALPEFQERQAKLSLHIDMCTKIMDRYKQQRLAEVCEVEQDVAVGRHPFKELYDRVRRLASDVSLTLGVRVRLVLLLVASANTREFSEAKKLLLLQETGLSNEAYRCTALSMFISRMGHLPQDAANPGANGGGNNGTDEANGKAGIGALMRRTLRTRNGGRPDLGASTSSTTSSPKGPEEATNGGDPYKNQAYLILNAAAHSTLSATDFPFFNGGMDGGFGGAGLGGAGGRMGSLGGALQQRRTLRAVDATTHGSAAASANTVLDLGHEGTFSLKTRRRIVLFILGGVTYGEVRAAYEVSQTAHVEVLIGSTSLLTPEIFLSCLTSLR